MEGEAEYQCVMPFFIDTDGYTDRDREMFVCGVEWQMIYELLKYGEPFCRPIHSDNASRFRMMAGRLGKQVTLTPSVAGWCDILYHGEPHATT